MDDCILYIVQNVHCTKCTLYKMYIVLNVHCTKCTLYKMYIVQNVHFSTKLRLLQINGEVLQYD